MCFVLSNVLNLFDLWIKIVTIPNHLNVIVDVSHSVPSSVLSFNVKILVIKIYVKERIIDYFRKRSRTPKLCCLLILPAISRAQTKQH